MQNMIIFIIFWKKNYDLEVEGKVRAQNIHIHTISQLGFNDKVSRGTQPLMSSVIYSKNDLSYGSFHMNPFQLYEMNAVKKSVSKTCSREKHGSLTKCIAIDTAQ